ncbi:MAG TPA: hypothetical protein V6C58_03770 [Allocoleopsis sp.]
MATFKDTARDFNGLYSDIYFSRGNLKGHCFYQCPATRLMVDIVKAPSGKYDVIFADMDNNQQTIDRLVRPTLKAAKASVINFLNNRISKLNLETEIVPETETVENISDIFSIDAIDEQLFSNNSIDNIDDIVGIDIIDEQLYADNIKIDVIGIAIIDYEKFPEGEFEFLTEKQIFDIIKNDDVFKLMTVDDIIIQAVDSYYFLITKNGYFTRQTETTTREMAYQIMRTYDHPKCLFDASILYHANRSLEINRDRRGDTIKL